MARKFAKLSLIPFLCNMTNTPRTRSCGIRSECHIRRHKRKSSLFAAIDLRYASVGTLSHPTALSLRNASRHSFNSVSFNQSSSATRHPRSRLESDWRNCSHSLRSWLCHNLAGLDGLMPMAVLLLVSCLVVTYS